MTYLPMGAVPWRESQGLRPYELGRLNQSKST
jgi:hypothetical protein